MTGLSPPQVTQVIITDAISASETVVTNAITAKVVATPTQLTTAQGVIITAITNKVAATPTNVTDAQGVVTGAITTSQGVITGAISVIPAQKKYAWKDHNPVLQEFNPPVLNQWQTLLDASDVSILYIFIEQGNDETASKDYEIKITLDSTVYFTTSSIVHNGSGYIYKNDQASLGGTNGIDLSPTKILAGDEVPLKALSAKIEMRQITAIGTNQYFDAIVRYETLEET